MSIRTRYLVEIGPEMAEIHLFMAVGHLKLCFLHFGPVTTTLSLDYIFCANCVMMRSDLAEILRF